MCFYGCPICREDGRNIKIIRDGPCWWSSLRKRSWRNHLHCTLDEFHFPFFSFPVFLCMRLVNLHFLRGGVEDSLVQDLIIKAKNKTKQKILISWAELVAQMTYALLCLVGIKSAVFSYCCSLVNIHSHSAASGWLFTCQAKVNFPVGEVESLLTAKVYSSSPFPWILDSNM